MRRLIKSQTAMWDAETGAIVTEARSGDYVTFIDPSKVTRSASDTLNRVPLAELGETESGVGETCGCYQAVEPPKGEEFNRAVWVSIGVLAILATFAGVLLLGTCVWHHFKQPTQAEASK